MKEKFKKEVELRFKELKEYTTKFNEKVTKEKKELIDKNKDLFLNNPTSVDIREIGKTFLFVNGLHQLDIKELQEQFLDAYLLFKKINDDDFTFSEEIEDTATILKNSKVKKAYILVNNEFKEVDSERIQRLLKNYEDKNLFKLYESQIINLLKQQ